jgi:acylphosphatase
MSQQKAISATVTGDNQQVGFRAMVMKQAIEYNLAGIAKNDPNMIVRFTLQGDAKRIDRAITAIEEGEITGHRARWDVWHSSGSEC